MSKPTPETITRETLATAGRHLDDPAAGMSLIVPLRVFMLVIGSEKTALDLIRAWNLAVESGPVTEELADMLEALAAVQYDELMGNAPKQGAPSKPAVGLGGVVDSPIPLPTIAKPEDTPQAAAAVLDAMQRGNLTDRQAGRALYALQLQLQAAKQTQPQAPPRPPGRPSQLKPHASNSRVKPRVTCPVCGAKRCPWWQAQLTAERSNA